MRLFYNFVMTLLEYSQLGRRNNFPSFDQCPSCNAHVRLYGHGFYERYACEGGHIYRIPIRRLRCRDCGITISILPDFLLPHYQHTAHTIIQGLRDRLFKERTSCLSRQWLRFYEKRFLTQQSLVEWVFREQGWREAIPSSIKEKAMKLLEMIGCFGEAPFLRRFNDHFNRNFMAPFAHSSYHI